MRDEASALEAMQPSPRSTRRRLLGGFAGTPLAGVFGCQATEADRKRQSKRQDKHRKRPREQGDAAQREDPSKEVGSEHRGGSPALDIQVFAADRALLTMWDAGTTPSGSDNLPCALALDGEGHFYVIGIAADLETEATVQKFRLPTPLR